MKIKQLALSLALAGSALGFVGVSYANCTTCLAKLVNLSPSTVVTAQYQLCNMMDSTKNCTAIKTVSLQKSGSGNGNTATIELNSNQEVVITSATAISTSDSSVYQSASCNIHPLDTTTLQDGGSQAAGVICHSNLVSR